MRTRTKPLRSMTGFGRGEFAPGRNGAPRVAVEVRSVNQRFLKLSVKLPGRLSVLEPRVRDAVQRRVSRGAVNVFVSVEDPQHALAQRLDESLVRAYVSRWRAVARRLKLKGDISLETLASLPDLFLRAEVSVNTDATWKAIRPALDKALGALEAMRRTEGEALKRELAARIKRMRGVLARIERRAPAVVVAYRRKLRARVRALLDDSQQAAAEENIAREMVFYADRSDIREEVLRLGSHFDQFAAALAAGGETGKRLEFLAQEMHREINTLGSKAADGKIARLVVELKGELEKIREQAANVE